MPTVSQLLTEKKANLATYLGEHLEATPEVIGALERLKGMSATELSLATRIFLVPQRHALDGCVDLFLTQTGMKVSLTPEVRARVVKYMQCFVDLTVPEDNQ